MSLIQEGAGNVPQQAFVQWNDPQGNRLISLNRDGSIFCQGVGFVSGGALLVGPIPIIQQSEDIVAGTAFTTLSFTLPLTTLYQITLYYGPSGSSGSGSWSPTVDWTDPSGNNLTLGSPYLGAAAAGDPNNLQSYSIPFFVKGGTALVLSGAYTGAVFPMNISVRVVAMP